MGKRWLLPLVIVLWAIAVSCSTPQVKDEPDNTLRVVSVNLFDGDDQKFSPFLGDMAGAVKWRYTGEKPELRISAEIWENGEKTKELASMGVMRTPDEQGKPFEGELIISLKDWSSIDPSASESETSTYAATVSCYLEGKGSSTNTFLVPASARHQGRMSVQLHEPVEVADDETVAVWGMQATDETSMSSTELTPESLKQAKWVIVFNIMAADE